METLGEEDEMYDMLKTVLRKAEMKAQEPPFFQADQRRKLKRVDEVRRPATRPEKFSRKLSQHRQNKNVSSARESEDLKSSC